MPNQSQDIELLRQYVQNRSADAFERIVREYAGIVLASARRQVGDSALAEDVTQAVFMVLANKASSLMNLPTLGGWLMKVTRYAAIDATRKQNRHRRHEQAAATERPELRDAVDVDGRDWEQLSTLLDEAITRLGSMDRDAVMLRYFQDESYVSIASKLGMNEEAARKRVDRALEKLRGMLARKGAVVSAAAIAAGASANASAAVSPALFGKIIASAAMGGTSATAAGLGISIAKGVIHMMTWTKATMLASIVGASVIGFGGAVGVTYLLAQSNVPPIPSTAPAAADDRRAIQGVWYYISVTQKGGVPQKIPAEMRTVITDQEFIQEIPGAQAKRARYTIDPVKKWLDLHQANGVVEGLYELNGDTLIFCGPETINLPRPTKIGDGPMLTVMTLSRTKLATTAPATQEVAAAVQAARTDIATLELALDAFEIDTGRYPSTAEGIGALLTAPPGAGQWRGPYVRRAPRDPWGNSYAYRYPGRAPRAIEIWSFGPDGKDGTADDITSWEK